MTERLHVHRSQLREANRRLALEVAEREKAEAALRHSEADYRIVVDSVHEVIFRTDAETRITFLNPAWTEVTGFTIEEGLGKPCMDFAHPQDRERHLPSMQQHLASGRGGARVEMRHLTKDGGYRWVEIQVQILADGDGGLVGLAGTLSDVTARHEHELVLREANAELARAARMKDQFLASMSHELRTPLNAVLGMSEALAEDTFGPITDQQRKAVGSIEASGRHLLDLINDILDLSKIEAGLFQIEPQPAQVRSLCDSCLMLVRGAAQKKRIGLECQVAPDVTFVTADARRLKQAIVNLLGNAIKFTPGDGTVRLAVALDAGAGVIRFAVSDTGIGIAPENQQRIFAAFVQADNSLSRQYGGSGLGLALVRKMVGLHGGTVHVESTLGAGSTFTITLPLANEGLTAAAGAGPRARVLVADDDSLTRTLVVRYLEDHGYEPVSCETGRQALAEARRERPAFILLDVQMPDIDGFETIRALRRDADLSHVPICAMSAMVHSVDRERCLAAGADAFLRKPIDVGELTEVIASHVPAGQPREVARP
jgi:PAS domain S-box-containing protein